MKYRTFYSVDCLMYGVQKQVTDYTGKHWTQVLPLGFKRGARGGKSAYTHYEGVAKRWMRELEAQA